MAALGPVHGRAILALVVLLGLGSAHAQRLSYTETATGTGLVPLGYPVPLPIDSQTPVDGFRSHAALVARLQALALGSASIADVEVGRSLRDRPIPAYRLGDADTLTVEGQPEPAALIAGTVHAREWASPEVAAALVEAWAAQDTDTGLFAYLRENLNLIVLPVLNVDGFLQTQRHPAQALQSEFAGDPQPAQLTAEPPEYRHYPRDGRFRRKTLRDADEILCAASDPDCAVADGMNGVDINRNHAPYFGSGLQNSAEPGSLVHRGAHAGSEPESQALYAAGALGPEARLRLFIDLHSYSQAYLGADSGQARRDAQTALLADVMARATGRRYPYRPSAAGKGIGSSDEHYGNRLQIPAYTLEIEPDGNGAVAYGSFGYHHDGFVLPASQIARVREELTRATLAGLYRMAGPPALLRAELSTLPDGAVVFSAQHSADAGSRRLRLQRLTPLQAGARYRLQLGFSKPMRVRDAGGSVVPYHGQTVPLAPRIALEGLDAGGAAFRHDLPTAASGWLGEAAQGLRYADDSYRLDFTLPATLPLAGARRLNLRVEAEDFSGLALDAQPATIADWSAGWSAYEDEAGRASTDTGGADRTLRLIDDGSPLFGPAVTGGGGALPLAGLILLLLATLGRAAASLSTLQRSLR